MSLELLKTYNALQRHYYELHAELEIVKVKLTSAREEYYGSCPHETETCQRLMDSKIYTCVKCGRER
jgi:hypothetical protein